MSNDTPLPNLAENVAEGNSGEIVFRFTVQNLTFTVSVYQRIRWSFFHQYRLKTITQRQTEVIFMNAI